MLEITEGSKRLFDLIVSAGAIPGALFLFWKGVVESQEGRRYKRAEQLDKLAEKFDADPLLRLATVVVDWHRRVTRFGDREVKLTNRDAIGALRVHDREGGGHYTGEQPLIRDALDALFTFLDRLDVAIESGLVDGPSAMKYFGYWICRSVSYDRHEIEPPEDGQPQSPQLLDVTPEELVRRYVEAYGNPVAIARLSERAAKRTP